MAETPQRREAETSRGRASAHRATDAARAESAPESPPRRAAEATPDRGFGPSLGWAVGDTVVPGLGLLGTRWRPFGIALLAVVLVTAVVLGVGALAAPQSLLGFAVDPAVLTAAAVLLIAFGVLWAASVVVTHLARRPASPTLAQRVGGGLVVGLLCLVVALPTFVGGRAVLDTAGLIRGVFGHGQVDTDPTFGTPADPWANKDRLNVLLLGGDNGQNRDEALGARTDSVILASVNTRTGDTVLFSMPRQTMRLPFPPGSKLAEKWPNGFAGPGDQSAYFLNSIYDNVPLWAPDAFPPGTQNKGAEALKLAMGEALGLKVDYYAMINMDGFIEFVNALGGITVNINHPVPVGGNTTKRIPPDRWLPPGPNQHLNGVDALWFARGRYGEDTGDYARMARQRCVVNAVVQQANPPKVLANYEALARSGVNIVATDYPTGRLPALMMLTMKARQANMTSVSFENAKDGFSTTRPDWTLVRQRVQAAINPPPPVVETAPEKSPASAQQTPSAAPSPTRGPGTAAPDAGAPVPAPSNVVDECAYHPDR